MTSPRVLRGGIFQESVRHGVGLEFRYSDLFVINIYGDVRAWFSDYLRGFANVIARIFSLSKCVLCNFSHVADTDFTLR